MAKIVLNLCGGMQSLVGLWLHCVQSDIRVIVVPQPACQPYSQEVVKMRTNRKDNMVNESPGKDIAALNEIARPAMSSLEFEQLLDLVTTRLADLHGVEEALLFVPKSHAKARHPD